MKIGVLQGRLSEPIDGQIQEFPIYYWREELFDLITMGLDGIEWIITEKNYLNNPFFLYDLSSSNILSVCVDNIISKNIVDFDYLLNNLKPTLERMEIQKVKNIVIPLLEDSSIIEPEIRNKFKQNIKKFITDYPNINFCFEFECDVETISELFELGDNVYVTYDTGNVTSFYGKEVNHEKNILYLNNKILNVHIKDRTFDSVTVPYGGGDTDFNTIFKSLNKINYDGNFILQLCREKSGNEYEYINKHFNLIKKNITF